MTCGQICKSNPVFEAISVRHSLTYAYSDLPLIFEESLTQRAIVSTGGKSRGRKHTKKRLYRRDLSVGSINSNLKIS